MSTPDFPDPPDSRATDEAHQAGAGAGDSAGAGGTAASQFRDQVASQRASLDDFDPEESLWSGGYSHKAMLGTWLVMGVVSLLLLVAAVLVDSFTLLMALGIIVLMWLVGASLYAWRRLGVDYELTTQRFIHKSGLFTRQADRIEVIDIDDVSYLQGPVQRMLGVGKIVITSSDRSHPELTMVGIDSVVEVAGLIDDIRRKERRRRSLHIEQI